MAHKIAALHLFFFLSSLSVSGSPTSSVASRTLHQSPFVKIRSSEFSSGLGVYIYLTINKSLTNLCRLRRRPICLPAPRRFWGNECRRGSGGSGEGGIVSRMWEKLLCHFGSVTFRVRVGSGAGLAGLTLARHPVGVCNGSDLSGTRRT